MTGKAYYHVKVCSICDIEGNSVHEDILDAVKRAVDAELVGEPQCGTLAVRTPRHAYRICRP